MKLTTIFKHDDWAICCYVKETKLESNFHAVTIDDTLTEMCQLIFPMWELKFYGFITWHISQ